MADKKITELNELAEMPAATDVLVVVDISSGETKKVEFQNLANTPVFGTEFQSNESDGTSSTFSDEFQQKLRLTTSSLPVGNYYISWSYEIRNTANDDMHESRVREDDTTTLAEEAGAHKAPLGIDAWRPNAGFKVLTGISGVKTFDIEYRAPETTVEIRRARLALWRIS